MTFACLPIDTMAHKHTNVNAPNTNATNKMEATIAQIAAKILDIDSLVPEGRDRRDFHDLSVETIKRALEVAYEAGKAAR